MIRLDTAGRDVTDAPGLWSEEDVEIVQTNYPHPDITTGQHTNGPAEIWVRLIEGDWRQCCTSKMHVVRRRWVENGERYINELTPKEGP